MPNFFKKLSHGAGNFFKKVDSGASNFFKKLPDQVANVSNQVGNTLQDVGSGVANVATKAGNFLEKNSGIISDVGAGLTIASGVGSEFAPAILAAGNSGAMLGQRLRQGGQQAQGSLNRLAQIQQIQSSNIANKISGQGMNTMGQARVQVSNLANKANAMNASNEC